MNYFNFKWDVQGIVLLVSVVFLLVGCGSGSKSNITMNLSSSSSAAQQNSYTITVGFDGGITSAVNPDLFGYQWGVAAGLSKTFLFTPKAGFEIDSVVGCNGTLSGTVYTTGAITQDCTVSATSKKTFASTLGVTDPALSQCIQDTGVKSIEALTILICDGKNVASLDGLSAFVDLEQLSIMGTPRVDPPFHGIAGQDFNAQTVLYNKWNSGRLSGYLDLSALTKLTSLNLNYNYGIEAVDLSKNTELTYLNLGHNLLNFLDVSSLVNLKTLFVHDNKLHMLDLSHNTKLTFLDLGDASYIYPRGYTTSGLAIWNSGDKGNPISTIDVSMLTELTDLYASYLNLTAIDLSKNTKLINLQINTTVTDVGSFYVLDPSVSISAIDLSHNSQLVTLDLSHNLLTDLDLSGLTQLTTLSVFNNELTNLTLPIGSSTLTEVDASNNNLSTLDVSSVLALKILNASQNSLADLDLSNNSFLISVDASDNNFSVLDLSNLFMLQEVYLGRNQLQTISFSGDHKLVHVLLDDNQLTSLDLSNLIMLSGVSAARNSLSSINFSASASINSLELSNNNFISLDVGALPVLKSVYLSDNRALSLLTVSASNSALAEIHMNDCNLTSLNTTVLPALTDLRIMQCPLTSIDFTNNTELTYVDLRGDLLAGVDFTKNTKLAYVNLQNNELTDISGIEFISNKSATLNLKMNSFNATIFNYLEKLRLVNGYSNLSY